MYPPTLLHRLLAVVALLVCVHGLGQKPTVNFDGTGLALSENGSVVQLLADKADYPAVLRVVNDLALDFGRVTGTSGSVSLLGADDAVKNASMIYNVTARASFALASNGSRSGGTVIAGTIGSSAMIDQLIAEGRIDVGAINGTWEAYVSTVIQTPMPGVAEAVVIAGMSNSRR